MEELISLVTPYVVLVIVLICISLLCSIIIKVMTIIELKTEKEAYDLIKQEEELEIQFKKERNDRDIRLCETLKEHQSDLLEEVRKIREIREENERRMQTAVTQPTLSKASSLDTLNHLSRNQTTTKSTFNLRR